MAGPTVMHGYWGDEERTARSLLKRSTPGGERRSTGPATWSEVLPDGNHRLLGRRDHQIKSRGYRIELGDIESALYAHPAIIECAVVAIPDELVTNRIKAFVAGNDGSGRADLLRFCADRLPQYMVPETIVFLDSLPKTSTGKIDRQALAAAREGD